MEHFLLGQLLPTIVVSLLCSIRQHILWRMRECEEVQVEEEGEVEGGRQLQGQDHRAAPPASWWHLLDNSAQQWKGGELVFVLTDTGLITRKA